MAGKITKILLVLAILQYALRADAQAVQTTEEVLIEHEEQGGQLTWMARAGRITKILAVLGILQYTVRMSPPTVKVTEELLRQHEEEHFLEMAELLMMEQRMQQTGITPGRLLLLACQEWWFWISAEILLVIFAIYWLPRQSNPDYDDDSEEETFTSSQEQVEEEEEEKDRGDKPDSCDTPEKPLDKVGTSDTSAKPFPRATFCRLHAAMRAASAYKYLSACKDMIDPPFCSCLRPFIVHCFH